MAFVSTIAGVGVIDARTRQGTITLPLTSQIPNRYIQFKDLYGAFGRSSLTLSTQVGESFDDGTTSKVFTDPFTFLTLYAASTTKWGQLGGTQTIQQTMSSLIVSSITIGNGLGWLQLPPIQTIVLSTNTINTDTIVANSTLSYVVSSQIVTSAFISSLALWVCTINGAAPGSGGISQANLTSTTVGLGTLGYISTAGGGGGITTANLTSTVIGLGTVGYISTAGGGIASIPSSLSTFQIFTSSVLASTVQTNVLSSQALFVSSFFSATRQMTPMFVTF